MANKPRGFQTTKKAFDLSTKLCDRMRIVAFDQKISQNKLVHDALLAYLNEFPPLRDPSLGLLDSDPDVEEIPDL
jgi:hypothetical protein